MCSRRSFVRSLSPSVVISVPGDADRARRRLVEAREDVHQRRLSGPRGAHDSGRLARRDVDRDAAQRVDSGLAFSVAAAHVMRDDDGPFWLSLIPQAPLLQVERRLRLQPSHATAAPVTSTLCRMPDRHDACTVRVWRSAPIFAQLSIGLAPPLKRSWSRFRTRSSLRRLRPHGLRSSGSYAHVARFEELWLLRDLNGDAPIATAHDGVYEAFRHERSRRTGLPTLRAAAVRSYAEDVRTRVLDALEHSISTRRMRCCARASCSAS